MDELIYELIELMKQTAPELWRIAQRQVIVKTVQVSVGLIIAITLLFVCFLVIKKLYTWKRSDDFDHSGCNDDNFHMFVGCLITGAVSFLTFLWFTDLLDSIIGLLINPEYYAIQEIIKLVK